MWTRIFLLLWVAALVGCEPSAKQGTVIPTVIEKSDAQPTISSMAIGTWEATLVASGNRVLFGLELWQDPNFSSRKRLFVLNGPEKIEVPKISTVDKKVRFEFPHYDSQIVAELSADGRRLRGHWQKQRGAGKVQQMAFTAQWNGEGSVAHDLPADAWDMSGRWRVKFSSSKDDAVAVFEATKFIGLEGTFLTTTGDYRYLSGTRAKNGKSFYLSCFDGAHAFSFKGTMSEQNTIKGDFWSSSSWHETFTATRDEKARLNSGFLRTRWDEQVSLASLKFPDLKGKIRSLDDPAFQGKARIIQIFGSWCPNCHDAAQFLAKLEEEYGEKGLAIVGVAFEHDKNFARSVRQVERYQARNGCKYPVLIAGISDKKSATASFRGLDAIRSFPTTIFLYADGAVRSVYSGFDGPATGAAHERLCTSFRSIIEELLSD